MAPADTSNASHVEAHAPDLLRTISQRLASVGASVSLFGMTLSLEVKHPDGGPMGDRLKLLGMDVLSEAAGLMSSTSNILEEIAVLMDLPFFRAAFEAAQRKHRTAKETNVHRT